MIHSKWIDNLRSGGKDEADGMLHKTPPPYEVIQFHASFELGVLTCPNYAHKRQQIRYVVNLMIKGAAERASRAEAVAAVAAAGESRTECGLSREQVTIPLR